MRSASLFELFLTVLLPEPRLSAPLRRAPLSSFAARVCRAVPIGPQVRAGQRRHGRILASLDMDDDADDDDSVSDTGQCTCMGAHEGQPPSHSPSPAAAIAAAALAASTSSATAASSSSSAPHKRATWCVRNE